jgi:Ca-activated chloride channel family protein
MLTSHQLGVSPTISVASDLVLLPVNVTDKQGNFVSGLKKENFSVYEEKELQDLTVFQHEDTPVGVGLVVDHSASMESKLPNVAAAISAFAKSGNPKDEMFVVDFSDKVRLEPLGGKAFTSVSSELENAVGPLSASGRTALYDAVAEGITHLELSQWQRRALIVISDGGDNSSFYNHTDILKLARQSGVLIYSIVLTDEHSKDENPKALAQLCRETGGVAFWPRTPESLMDFSLVIARDLREQYTLGFVPHRKQITPSFRKIEVHVLAPTAGKVNIRTRRGYLLEGSLFPPAPYKPIRNEGQ